MSETHHTLRSITKFTPDSDTLWVLEVALFVLLFATTNSALLYALQDNLELLALIGLPWIGICLIVTPALWGLLSTGLFFSSVTDLSHQHPQNTTPPSDVNITYYLTHLFWWAVAGHAVTVLSSTVTEDSVYYTVLLGDQYGVLEFELETVVRGQDEKYSSIFDSKRSEKNVICSGCGSSERCWIGFVEHDQQILADIERWENWDPQDIDVCLCSECIDNCLSQTPAEQVSVAQTQLFANVV